MVKTTSWPAGLSSKTTFSPIGIGKHQGGGIPGAFRDLERLTPDTGPAAGLTP